MLCAVSSYFENFFLTWLMFITIGSTITLFGSALLFWGYYWKPTYEQWVKKCNPQYPKVDMIRLEIFKMLKGVIVGVFCPSLSLWMSARGYSKAYCGLKNGITYEICMFFFIMITSDLYEFSYHYLGHTVGTFWLAHKSHHKFYNPTPFAVIADDLCDQFFRSLPLVIFPYFLETNIEVMFFEYSLWFYGYGLYLHWGYEFDWPDAHHPWINTAYHHWLHHAKSVAYKAYHCGFFFKFWDILAGSVWDKECLCSKCAVKKGLRTREVWDKIIKPDYSSLLEVKPWIDFMMGKKSTKINGCKNVNNIKKT